MCLRVFIASTQELPVIDWKEETPTLYIRPLHEPFSRERLAALFPNAYFYEAGSFMGCGCGFMYGAWSKEDPSEDHDLRKRDVLLLINYLRQTLSEGPVQLFCTWWEQLKDEYEIAAFSLDHIDPEEFDFQEDMILQVTSSDLSK